jgi:Arc/MetJ-type ribon-helix-helix transcriptional regulator
MNMGNDINSARELRLPEHLCEAVEKLIKDTRFKTVEEFLSFVLQELTSCNSAQSEAEERKVIEERLRDLGYL